MQTGVDLPSRTAKDLADAIQSRVQAGARRYRGAVMRYLVRPPLSLKPKYAAFLVDLVRQSDHMQDVLARAADRMGPGTTGALLRTHQREERQRMQLALGDLRRLGYPQEDWPERGFSVGDTALRAYCTTISYERPAAMLGILLMFIGLAAEISSSIVRLLVVGAVPREAMRWLLLRESSDAGSFRDLCAQVAELVRDPADQGAVLEAVEVSGELLALGAASRPPL